MSERRARVAELSTAHIDVTRQAELILVMPATANVLARAAHGIADDLVSTCLVAARSPVVFAPSMNDAMWSNRAVQRNVATLQADGHGVVPPAHGIAVADGTEGPGAMPDVVTVLRWTRDFLLRTRDDARECAR